MAASSSSARHRARGFAYAMVLALAAVLAIAAQTAAYSTARLMQAEREAELLFRGQAYQRAIRSFVEAGGGYPRRLEDLLNDPRSPGRRHLRQLYADSMAVDGQWQLLRAPDGGISGVASSSDKPPLKQANFPRGLASFEGAQTYRDWRFDAARPGGLRSPLPAASAPAVSR